MKQLAKVTLEATLFQILDSELTSEQVIAAAYNSGNRGRSWQATLEVTPATE